MISIVCRFIFNPLEEIALNLFSKFTKEEKNKLIDVLAQYLAGVIGIGICAVVFSQANSFKFLTLVYSSKWATDSSVEFMKAYCIYLLFMALNGISEAFAYGLANEEVLHKL